MPDVIIITIAGLLIGMLIGMIGVLVIAVEFKLKNYESWWRTLPWITGTVMSYLCYEYVDFIVYILRYRWII